MEQTVVIIKPDAVKAGHTEKIIECIKSHGFSIKRQKGLQLSIDQSRILYDAYQDRDWFNAVAEYMASGPLVVLILEKENAILAWRRLIGKSNPAEWGVLRKMFGTSYQHNALHGSSSIEEVVREINLLFGSDY